MQIYDFLIDNLKRKKMNNVVCTVLKLPDTCKKHSLKSVKYLLCRLRAVLCKLHVRTSDGIWLIDWKEIEGRLGLTQKIAVTLI